MSLVIARWIAATLAGLIVGVLSMLGVPVTEEHAAGILEWLMNGINLFGTILFLALYGTFHKFVNKWFNPNDVAKEGRIRP